MGSEMCIRDRQVTFYIFHNYAGNTIMLLYILEDGCIEVFALYFGIEGNGSNVKLRKINYVKRAFLFTSFEPLNFCYTNEL